MVASRLCLLAALVALGACDQPAHRSLKLAPVPVPLLPVDRPTAPATRVQSITWDPQDEAFRLGGTPLKAAKLWTFDGTSEGFVLTGGLTSLVRSSGLRLTNQVADPVLRSARGLALNGARASLVLVRLTRTQASSAWDGSLYYTTAAHPESQAYFAKPVMGGNPALNETLILVYDMSHPLGGGEDWVTSTIDQIRIDTDDSAGGSFVVQQIAVTENPGRAALGLAPKS